MKLDLKEIKENMVNYNKPLGLKQQDMRDNYYNLKTKILKNVVANLSCVLYHNPEGRYRKAVIVQAVADLKRYFLQINKDDDE